MYLQCTTNNRAESVFFSFLEGNTGIWYTLPRVCSNKGGENVKACHFMVSQRGVGQGSHIAGPSTHNQHIERLWRNVCRCVDHELFYYMEEEQLMMSLLLVLSLKCME